MQYLEHARDPEDVVNFIHADSHAKSLAWGYILLAGTILFGLSLLAYLHFHHVDYDTLRELLANVLTGEIGLIAGRSSHRD